MAFSQFSEVEVSNYNPVNVGLQMVNAKKRKADGQLTVVTSKEVAKMAGVSVATVSRVVNGEDNVRQATRDKVLAAVDKLGYVPNEFAKQMAIRRHALVA